MKKFGLWIAILGVTFISCIKGKPFVYPKIEELKFNPIEWQHPEPRRVELDNGLVLYILEDHKLPLIDAYVYIKAGSVYDPEDRVGLSEITVRTIRTGGTKNRSPEEIDSVIEYDAARIEFYSGDIPVMCSFSSLKENFDEILDIFADMLISPIFREDKFSVEIEKLKEEIRRRNDSPIEIALVNFTKKLRRNHPTGWFHTLDGVSKITREDVMGFHKKYYHPNNLIMAIVGNFDTDSMINELNSTFKEWEKVETGFPNIPDLEEKYERKVYYVEKDVKQSTIIMGHLSLYRKDPDLYSLIVADRILGGGFSSRLFKNIREARGLAYSVGSGLTPGDLYRGEFDIFCQTEAKTTAEAIELILKEVERMKKEEVEVVEFEDANEGIKNGFVFTFESPLQIARNQAYLEFYDIPMDYYDKYLDNIDKVTRKTILEATSKRFLSDEMEILVVGKASEFDKPLDTFGKVEKIELEE